MVQAAPQTLLDQPFFLGSSNGCSDEFIGPMNMILVSMFILFVLMKAGLIGDQLAA